MLAMLTFMPDKTYFSDFIYYSAQLINNLTGEYTMNERKHCGIGFLDDTRLFIDATSELRYLCATGKLDDPEAISLHNLIYTGIEGYLHSYANPLNHSEAGSDEAAGLFSAWRYRLEKAAGESVSGSTDRFIALTGGLDAVRDCDLERLKSILRYDFIMENCLNAETITGSPLNMGRICPKCMYGAGTLITDSDMGFFNHVEKLDKPVKRKITNAIVTGFIESFKDDGKSLDGLGTVAVSFAPGYLALLPELNSRFREEGLELCTGSVRATGESLQMEFDHKFDWTLFLNEETATATLAEMKKVLNRKSADIAHFAGTVHLMCFGRKKTEPVPHNLLSSPTSEQNSLFREFINRRTHLLNRYVKQSRTSYTGIAFPLPDACDSFSEAFNEMLEVNTMDQDIFMMVQEVLIEALDAAEAVHIQGKENNRTDLRIAMQKLRDPASETNFLNCLATVNIPLGEVFTTPSLTGTSGVLHIQEIYLEGILFRDLTLEFEDGYVKDFSCGNCVEPAKSRELVHTALIHPHETLPVGEFAIGTNTAAYRMAVKYGLREVLPVLVAEKMGPHIAIGDPCFKGREELPCFNRNGREMTARTNEKTRGQDNRYTSTHKDITIPYNSIGKLCAMKPDGSEIAIINGGRFVLPGTEYLNIYLDEGGRCE